MVTETTSAATDKIRCDACPVMCYIKPGAAGACDRYANDDGTVVRTAVRKSSVPATSGEPTIIGLGPGV